MSEAHRSRPSGRRRLSAVGLFCGCGGFDLGASRAGFEVVAAFDNDPVAVETYRRNISSHVFLRDLAVLGPFQVPKDIDLVVGGPPCQGFSSAGKKDRSDPRNRLWGAYLHALSVLRPKVFLLENVYGFQREYDNFVRSLVSECGDAYAVCVRKFNTQFYGVPQHRLRLVVAGIRRDVGQEIEWPAPQVEEFWGYKRHAEGLTSLKDAVQGLGPPGPCELPREQTWGCDHHYLPLEPSHLKVAKHIPNGGSLRSIPDKHMPEPFFGRERPPSRGWPWYYRKPDPLLAARTVTASTRPIYSEVLAPDVTAVKRRGIWTWEPIDPAEHTRRDGLYVSPVDQRRLTIRESAALQTFPDDFVFFGDLFEKQRQIGNAVPVRFAEHLCRAVARQIRRAGRHPARPRAEQQLKLSLG
ncbi:MAG: DNA cytosine methyltransferase [Anaeromyxobacter sp.]|nr:DNA cytosine methyltransferase [Anaeromyxobacter sp.]